MRFQGYRYKFKLNASHTILIARQRGETHSHTFEINLYVEMKEEEILDYRRFEEDVNHALEPYRKKYLNDVAPFDRMEPTLENIGRILHRTLVDSLGPRYRIVGMEIGETPSRVFVLPRDDRENTLSSLTGAAQDVSTTLLRDFQNIASRQVASADGGEKGNLAGQEAAATRQDLPAPRPAAVSEADVSAKCIPTDSRPAENVSAIKNPDQSSPPAENASPSSGKWVAAARRPRVMEPLKIAAAFLIILGASVAFVLYLYREGNYPWGSDTLGHIFRADLLYKNIKQGNLFPLYSGLWYNGTQPFRYWGPMNYYILAAFEFLTRGNALQSFSIFTGALFFVGAAGWLLWGIREKRVAFSVVLGILWFCLPDNLRVFFSEGNIPRCIISALFPFLFFFIWRLVEYGKKGAVVPIVVIMCLMIPCHLMISAMVGVTAAVFLFIYGAIKKDFVPSLQATGAMLLSFPVCGVWVYPALKGGLLSIDSGVMFSDVMSTVASSFTKTLNPLMRLDNFEIYYFGLSVALISLAGILLAKKKSMPGFITALLILFGTNTAIFPVLSKLPMNQLFWMFRYTPLAYGVFVIALLEWKTLRKWALSVCVLLLAADSFLSFRPLVHMVTPSAEMVSMLKQAKSITNQRIALLDASEFGSFPDYYIGGEGKVVANAFGWASQGATTFTNDVLLNTALADGYYPYLFDRSVELGCDTVIVKKDKIPAGSEQSLLQAAQKLQYTRYQSPGLVYLFHRQTPRQFGVVTRYRGLAVGRTAANITLEFPYFEEGASNNLQDYSYEKLSSYKTIFLSGFQYSNKVAAEQIINRLAANGVKVMIDMNNIPVDTMTNRMTFLGVTAEPISFGKRLPDLFENGKLISVKDFQKENQNWNTVYLDNVPDPSGISWISGKKIVFYGRGTNPNISFMGLNLPYLSMANKDRGIQSWLGTVMGVAPGDLPERSLSPLTVQQQGNRITIASGEDNVDTTLADLDAFKSSRAIRGDHNLLFVDRGITRIEVGYPYLIPGLIVTGIGIAGVVLLVFWAGKKRRAPGAAEQRRNARS